MILEINAIDRTTDIAQTSLRYSQTLSKAPGKLTFSMVAGSKTIPTIGQSVVFKLDDVTAYFTGTITDRKEKTIGNKVVTYTYTCLDGYFLLDKRLVIKAYKSTDIATVIDDIITNFVSGITFTPPAGTPSVSTARFNYMEPSRAIKRLADEAGWDWYIDAANELHLVAPGDMAAPTTIEDDNDSHVSNSLNFDSNLTELKNVVFIRGGEYEEAVAEGDSVDKYEANGVDNTFPLVYRYADTEVTVNGTAQTVGIDFLDDPVDFDVLYNFQEKLIRFPDGTLTASDIVRVFGNAKIPLIVQLTDDSSVTAYGGREHIELNKSINSIEEAEQLAGALIDQWREGSKEGGFKTYLTGFVVGQTLTINSTKFGASGVYKINAVRAAMHGHNDFEFTVDFLKSGQTTFDDILVNLIGRDRDNVTIASNEVLQRLLSIGEEFGFTDEIVSVTTKTGPYYYATALGGHEEGVWGFSTWGT